MKYNDYLNFALLTLATWVVQMQEYHKEVLPSWTCRKTVFDLLGMESLHSQIQLDGTGDQA